MIFRKSFVALGLIVSVAGLTVLTAALAPEPANAGNQRVITIHDGGAEQTIATDATTVGEALKRAGVTLDSHDSVEPAAKTELTAPAYTVNVYRARPVTVIDGAKRKEIMSPYQSARSIVTHAGVELYAEDQVVMERINDFMTDEGIGLKLTIDRAMPVNLVLYGVQTQIRTRATTVSELLKEKKIVLGRDDGASLPGDTALTAGIIVDVWRNGIQTKTEEQPVAFETESIQDADRDIGFKEIREPGKPGKKMVTYEVTLKNGQEVARKEIQSVVTEQPKKQVQVVGAKRGSVDAALADAMARLRQCEAGGRYDRNSGNGYYGAYQYDVSTWAGYGGFRLPSEAPPAVQDAKAAETYGRRGWSPWPGCTRKLGLQDVYR
ncbi:DUF348 domain-containing protein [Candidatus Saccharibacteria bacterium]|nr:DUF348 domain-containing protein [Candidatus Saccharibacteria bacterium]